MHSFLRVKLKVVHLTFHNLLCYINIFTQQSLLCFTQLLVNMLLSSHSVASDFVTPWTAACQASLTFTVSQSLLKLMSIESMILSKHLILCCPLLLPPSVFPSIRVFSNALALHVWWLKYWSFSFSINPSRIEGLISFRSDWFDLLVVQGTLKSLLRHHSSKVNMGPCQIYFIPLSNNIYRVTPHGGSQTSCNRFNENFTVFLYLSLS